MLQSIIEKTFSFPLAIRQWADANLQNTERNRQGGQLLTQWTPTFKELKEELENKFSFSENYVLTYLQGQGAPRRIPMLGILNRRATETLMEGVYVIYLWAADGSSVYLTLNQGATNLLNRYRQSNIEKTAIEKTKEELERRVRDFRAKLGSHGEQIIGNTITLNGKKTDILYEAGCILAIEYKKGKVPSDDILLKDLQYMIRMYKCVI